MSQFLGSVSCHPPLGPYPERFPHGRIPSVPLSSDIWGPCNLMTYCISASFPESMAVTCWRDFGGHEVTYTSLGSFVPLVLPSLPLCLLLHIAAPQVPPFLAHWFNEKFLLSIFYVSSADLVTEKLLENETKSCPGGTNILVQGFAHFLFICQGPNSNGAIWSLSQILYCAIVTSQWSQILCGWVLIAFHLQKQGVVWIWLQFEDLCFSVWDRQ